ncbi:hypothetical protein OIU78_006631 [Salix suchowensis]|nr:hypothetical protein OIU78_006631 [Salix suchowensis]
MMQVKESLLHNFRIPMHCAVFSGKQYKFPEQKKRKIEAEGENFNDYCKFLSETSSSDVTQAPVASDEANSSANICSSMGVDFSSNLIQDMQMPIFYSSLLHQFPYPPLELEDFPQISIAECMKPSKPEISSEYMMYKDCMDGTLEELCSSRDNSSINVLPMQDY